MGSAAAVRATSDDVVPLDVVRLDVVRAANQQSVTREVDVDDVRMLLKELRLRRQLRVQG